MRRSRAAAGGERAPAALSGGVGAARREWRVARRYALFQLPEFGAAALVLATLHWADVLTPRTAVLLFLMWIAKEAALYPLTRDAYTDGEPLGAERLVGHRGVARQRLAPRGLVFVGGALWRGCVDDGDGTIESGSEVEVVRASTHTVTVAAVRDRERS